MFQTQLLIYLNNCIWASADPLVLSLAALKNQGNVQVAVIVQICWDVALPAVDGHIHTSDAVPSAPQRNALHLKALLQNLNEHEGG